MKKFALGLTLSTVVAAQISAAAAPIGPVAAATNGGGIVGPSTVEVDAQQIQVNAGTPIPFKPFPVADLRTGQPLSPNAIVTLRSGKRMKASDYFAQLNQLEQQFNAMGYSLRQRGTVKLQALKIDPQQLQNQKAMIDALPPIPLQLMATAAQPPPPAPTPAGGAHIAAFKVLRPDILAFHRSASMSRNWDYTFGDTDAIGAGLHGQISVNGSDTGLNANGTARATGAILGSEWDLIRVTGNLNAPKAGAGSAKLNLYVVGVGDVPVLDQPLNQSVWSVSNSASRSLDVHQDFHFFVGPIPMSARLGVRGNAGVQYGLTVRPAGINVALQPNVQVDAYGEGGVDLGIASGGIGCDLALLHNQLRFGVDGGLGADASGPTLSAHLYGYDNLEALSGRLYAYAKVDLWLYDKEWDWDIWKFDGIQKNFTLFDESKTLRLTADQFVVRAP